jgi:6-phosphogluconolactonase/glucosamine-6-phosphate isomerase/deaminase
MAAAAAQKLAYGGAVVHAFGSNPDLSAALGRAVAAASAAATGATFTVAISGGSLPALLAAGLVGDAAVPEAGT